MIFNKILFNRFWLDTHTTSVPKDNLLRLSHKVSKDRIMFEFDIYGQSLFFYFGKINNGRVEIKT